MNIVFNLIIHIIEDSNFYLDKTDLKNLEAKFEEFSNIAVKKKNRKFFSLEVIKYAIYYFQKYYQIKTILYVEDILLDFIVCFLISNKFIEDNGLDNGRLCRLFHLNLRDVNKHEFDIVNKLDFKLYIQSTMINNHIYNMLSKSN
jgi:hypothetical protein